MAEAHEAFAAAIRLGPRRAMNWGNLGLVLRDLRRPGVTPAPATLVPAG